MISSNVSFVYVLIGVKGNLARTKKLPALYRLIEALDRSNRLGHINIVALDREISDLRQLKETVHGATKSLAGFSETFFQRCFWPLFSSQELDLSDLGAYLRFRNHVACVRGSYQRRLVFDLSVLPGLYPAFVQGFERTNPTYGAIDESTLLLVEKPVGHNSASAEELLARMATVFGTGRVKVWDHFLGKEGLRRLIEHRCFAQAASRCWNSQHIRDIELDITETQGLEGRRHFALSGIIEDMVVNHAAVMLGAIAMRKPEDHGCAGFARALEAGLSSFLPIAPRNCICGRYAENQELGLPGYLEEVRSLGLAPEEERKALQKPTLFAGVMLNASAAWNNTRRGRLPDGTVGHGTQFRVRVMKRASRTVKRVVLNFGPPQKGDDPKGPPDQTWIYHLEPGPTTLTRIARGCLLGREQIGSDHPRDAYEQLLHDVLVEGRSDYFLAAPQVAAGWRMFEPVLDTTSRRIIEYPAQVSHVISRGNIARRHTCSLNPAHAASV